MARPSLTKTLLHAEAKSGTTVHRWVVGVFNNKANAAMYATLIKAAHASKNAARILELDPGHAKDEKGVPLPLAKLSAQDVQYNPHLLAGSGLDEDPAPAQS